MGSREQQQAALLKVTEWSRSEGRRCTVKAGFARTAMNAAFFSLPTKVIPRLLLGITADEKSLQTFKRRNVPVIQYLLLWFDNSGKQTAGRAWTRGPLQIKRIETTMLYVGREEMIGEVIGLLIREARQLQDMTFLTSTGVPVKFIVKVVTGDNHLKSIICAGVGSSSRERSTSSESDGDYFDRVPFQGRIFTTIGELRANAMDYLQMVDHFMEPWFKANSANLEHEAQNTALAEATTMASKLYKRVYMEPMFCRAFADPDHDPHNDPNDNILLGSPTMHTDYNCLKNGVQVISNLISEDSPAFRTIMAKLNSSNRLYENGEFSLSAFEMRKLSVEYLSLQPEIEVGNPFLRKYSLLMRLLVHGTFLNYSPSASSARHMLADQIINTLAYILVSTGSAWFGGQKPTDRSCFKLITATIYWMDKVRTNPALRRVLAKFDMSISDMLEEGAEESFNQDHAIHEAVRNRGNLEPMLKYANRLDARKRILRSRKATSGHINEFANAPRLQDLITCECVFSMQTVLRKHAVQEKETDAELADAPRSDISQPHAPS
jgi:hypothetical protein